MIIKKMSYLIIYFITFFYSGKWLKTEIAKKKDLDDIKIFYKSLLKDKMSIKQIIEYQFNYIQLEVNPINQRKKKYLVNGRIKALENLLNELSN